MSNRVRSTPVDRHALERQNTGSLLSMVFRSFVTHLHEHLVAGGYPDVTPAQTSVFQYIGAQGSRVGEMAERAQMTKQGMAQLVAYLEERGYVERRPDPRDGRAQIVCLTDRGWAVVTLGRQAIAEIEAAWAERVGAERLQALRGTLQDLLCAE